MSKVTWVVGNVLRGSKKDYVVEDIGRNETKLSGVWFNNYQIAKWLKAGMLTKVSEGDK